MHTLHTAGNGYWSKTARAVTITHMELSIMELSDVGGSFGELRVYFDTSTWNTETDGLIYTDKLFIKELYALLQEQGYAANDSTVDYSEQGMQGEDYVSLDVRNEFIDTWISKYGEACVEQ